MISNWTAASLVCSLVRWFVGSFGRWVVGSVVPNRPRHSAADSKERQCQTGGRGTYAMQLEHYQPCRQADPDDNHDSLVGAPRRPTPKVRDSGVALPEPDEDRPGD